ncbi:MAG: hypothetical protein J0M02_19725 [Planctomycetes bacterium]|nr:hypothetical protein [Planctomycetota bacterium]
MIALALLLGGCSPAAPPPRAVAPVPAIKPGLLTQTVSRDGGSCQQVRITASDGGSTELLYRGPPVETARVGSRTYLINRAVSRCDGTSDITAVNADYQVIGAWNSPRLPFNFDVFGGRLRISEPKDGMQWLLDEYLRPVAAERFVLMRAPHDRGAGWIGEIDYGSPAILVRNVQGPTGRLDGLAAFDDLVPLHTGSPGLDPFWDVPLDPVPTTAPPMPSGLAAARARAEIAYRWQWAMTLGSDEERAYWGRCAVAAGIALPADHTLARAHHFFSYLWLARTGGRSAAVLGQNFDMLIDDAADVRRVWLRIPVPADAGDPLGIEPVRCLIVRHADGSHSLQDPALYLMRQPMEIARAETPAAAIAQARAELEPRCVRNRLARIERSRWQAEEAAREGERQRAAERAEQERRRQYAVRLAELERRDAGWARIVREEGGRYEQALRDADAAVNVGDFAKAQQLTQGLVEEPMQFVAGRSWNQARLRWAGIALRHYQDTFNTPFRTAPVMSGHAMSHLGRWGLALIDGVARSGAGGPAVDQLRQELQREVEAAEDFWRPRPPVQRADAAASAVQMPAVRQRTLAEFFYANRAPGETPVRW